MNLIVPDFYELFSELQVVQEDVVYRAIAFFSSVSIRCALFSPNTSNG